jgi:hypothetical protein
VKKLLLLIVGFISLAAASVAQPYVTLSVGSASDLDSDDQYAMSKTWPTPGSQTDDGLRFFSGMSGMHLKAGLGWEITDHFSAGLVYQMINFSSAENFRKADIVSLGAQFRVNFSSSQEQWVPFVQAAYYFSNSHTYDQQQATNPGGTQTQPAFHTTGTTTLAFNFDFGLEYKIMKSMGLQLTAGLNGMEPIADIPPGVDYSPYFTPTRLDGGLSITFAGGIKYYFGRGGKKRDF